MSITRPWAIIFTALCFLVLMECAGIPILSILVSLLAGWGFYAARVFPQISVEWGTLAMGMLSLIGVLVIGHFMLGWLYRETRHAVWRPRWTVMAVLIVVLMFACGIAATGVTHQTAWLARSDEPMFRYRGREAANRVKCASGMRQIYHAMADYALANEGLLPDRLEQVVAKTELDARSFACPSANDSDFDRAVPREQLAQQLQAGYTSYADHGRGLRSPLASDAILLTEPLLNHDDAGMNVLFGSGEVKWVPADELGPLFSR